MMDPKRRESGLQEAEQLPLPEFNLLLSMLIRMCLSLSDMFIARGTLGGSCYLILDGASAPFNHTVMKQLHDAVYG